MSVKERQRLVELERVKRGEQSLGEAGRRLGVSYRQAKRLWRRYCREGERGLLHGSRGRSSNRRKSAELRDRCMGLYRERLEGFGPTLAAEKLSEWGWKVDHETLRRWLMAEGLWRCRPRRLKHRRWRPRRERFGALVQLDGSHHDWFGREELCCLMGMIDDATGTRLSLLAEQETTEAALHLLWRWIERYGVPLAVYTDRKSVYITEREPTLDEELAGEPPLTAFGKSCRKLGIEVIAASSPQAKGRVERCHAVYQDRLVKEIRLRGLENLAEVNELLGPQGFDEALNDRFAVPAMDSIDAHRALPVGLELGGVLAFETVRAVNNDWTVRHDNQWYQITGPKRQLPAPKSKVVIQRRLDGTVHLLHRGKALEFEKLPGRPQPTAKAASLPKTAVSPRSQKQRPADDHPWRPFLYGRKAREARRGGPRPDRVPPAPPSTAQPLP